jgi:hypothetical protein
VAKDKHLLAVQLAFLLEQVSKKFVPNAPSAPISRIQFTNALHGLSLEVPLYAAFKPPKNYVFMLEDQYFEQVEALLEQVNS